MAKVAVYNFTDGKKVEEITLDESVFGVSANPSLLHQAYVAAMANARQSTAHTKDRSERAGSGKKPWKQKGTGQARTGSVRNPIWRKGGVIFGPSSDRNFSKNITKKMRQKAICLALSEKVRGNRFIVVNEFELSEKKTKNFASALKALSISGSAVIGFFEDERNLFLFARNIPRMTCVDASTLSVKDLLNHKTLVLSRSAVRAIEQRYGKKGSVKDEEKKSVKSEKVSA